MIEFQATLFWVLSCSLNCAFAARTHNIWNKRKLEKKRHISVFFSGCAYVLAHCRLFLHFLTHYCIVKHIL